MRTKSNNGNGFLVYGSWIREIEQARRERERADYEGELVKYYKPTPKPNVVGGSLDGATMPEGTRDGQQYRWDETKRRWVHVS